MKRWIGLLLLGGLAGCSSEGERLEPVEGRITLAGKPLPGGTVSFRPAAGNATLHHPTGRIAADGTFKLLTNGREGAPAGQYKVLIFSDANAEPGTNRSAHPQPPKWRVNAKYTTEGGTDLKADVVAAPTAGRYDFAVKE
jgi:hypothetical protein